MDVANFWFLHTIHTSDAVLRHLYLSKRGHPEELFARCRGWLARSVHSTWSRIPETCRCMTIAIWSDALANWWRTYAGIWKFSCRRIRFRSQSSRSGAIFIGAKSTTRAALAAAGGSWACAQPAAKLGCCESADHRQGVFAAVDWQISGESASRTRTSAHAGGAFDD